MRRIRQQGHRVRQQAEADFSRNEPHIQRGANGEGTIMPRGMMMVVVSMIVMMVRHASLMLPQRVVGQSGRW